MVKRRRSNEFTKKSLTFLHTALTLYGPLILVISEYSFLSSRFDVSPIDVMTGIPTLSLSRQNGDIRATGASAYLHKNGTKISVHKIQMVNSKHTVKHIVMQLTHYHLSYN